MQLLRLTLQNFRQHERTDLELGPGLLAVVGPNGAGKSTLLEAIAWVLYGTAAARGTRDTIKRRGAAVRARVEVTLDFVLGTHTYRVVRTLTNAELFQDGAAIANSSATVTERITVLLGMTRDEFFNTYFTGQKDLSVMAAMTPAERGRFLSRVLGYEQLKEAQDRLRDRRSIARAELSGIEQGLADPTELAGALEAAAQALDTARGEHQRAGDRATAAAGAIAQLTPDWDAAVARRAAWQGLDGERKVAEGKVLEARAAFQALDRELIAASEARHKLEPLVAALAGWTALVAERDALDRAAAEVTSRSKVVARHEEVTARIAALAAEAATLPAADVLASTQRSRQEALAARDAVVAQLGEHRTRWTQDAQEARTKLDLFRDRYKELREQRRAIEAAGPDGTCPFCQRPLGTDVEHTIGILDGQVAEVEASGNYFRQRVEQLASPPDDVAALERQRATCEAALQQAATAVANAEAAAQRRLAVEREQRQLQSELVTVSKELEGPAATYDPARHQVVRNTLATLEPMRRDHDVLAGLAQRATTLAPEAALAEQRATAAESVLAELERRIAALEWDAERFAALEARVEGARQELQAAEMAQVRSSAALEVALQQRDAALNRQADRAAKALVARALGGDVERWNELDRAFGELRLELNQQMRPDLRERAATFLLTLTQGRYDDLELDEDYVATVVDGGEVKPVISGGEEDVLHLALRLAISEMIAERAGQPLSLLVLDEVFGSLDEEHRRSVVELLRALADRFPQVILISHIEGLRDAFDRVVRVDYDAARGVSTVREDTPEVVGVAD